MTLVVQSEMNVTDVILPEACWHTIVKQLEAVEISQRSQSCGTTATEDALSCAPSSSAESEALADSSSFDSGWPSKGSSQSFSTLGETDDAEVVILDQQQLQAHRQVSWEVQDPLASDALTFSRHSDVQCEAVVVDVPTPLIARRQLATPSRLIIDEVSFLHSRNLGCFGAGLAPPGTPPPSSRPSLRCKRSKRRC
mmetsp:Transcript_94368/g.149235  ORF Transcript_94368/g.149235 Transcript_94368/m.149235 type:complete len:196 (+) Transcript_94368:115-702(+)